MSVAVANDRILVMGDSLSAAHNMRPEDGWVELLANALEPACQATFVNASISGETTAGGKTRLPEILSRQHPTIVILELGGNDGLRGLSVAAMKENLSEMIRMSQESGARTVLSGIRIPTNYGSRYTDAFTSAFEDVASATGADYMPFLIEEVALRTELMQADGIHPNEAAQPIIADHVLEHIEPLLANCTAPSLTTGS